MIQANELKRVDSGSGYFVGEIEGSHHPRLKYLKTNTLVTLFDGVDVALDFVQKNMDKPKRSGSSAEYHPGFHTFRTFEEAVDTFRSKPESVTHFDPAELRIKDNSEAGNEVDYDVTGDFIDMGRFMEGVPESVGTMHQGNARNRRVTIVINLTHYHGVREDVITHRSERILRLVDALEAGGIRCGIVGIESSECNHTEVVIKRHEEPLSVTDLAVATHTDFFRRVIFRFTEYSKTFESGYGSGVVFSMALTPEVIDSGVNDELDIVIDGNNGSKEQVDNTFDQLERLLVWEMSKPVPEVTSIKIDRRGIYFNPNGARDEMEIRREGQDVIRGDN